MDKVLLRLALLDMSGSCARPSNKSPAQKPTIIRLKALLIYLIDKYFTPQS